MSFEASYRSALLSGAAVLRISIGESLADAMTVHQALVAKWSERINLTAIKDPVAAAHLHGLDSLLFAELIADEPRDAVDVGSGAGFPGLVVALARPKLKLTLLEPIRRRASFLRVALAELGRADVAVVEGKLEANLAVWPTDIIMSRATLPPLDLISRSADRLRPGGALILSSGRNAPTPAEIDAAAGDGDLVRKIRRELELPGGELRILDVLGRSR